MSAALAFVVCTERGPLEGMTELLARSLRRHGGALADAPIHSYAPRAGRGLTPASVARLSAVGVHHENRVLNRAFTGYPLGNKPLACAHAERTLDAETLVFIDGDQLVVGEGPLLRLDGEADAALRPVDVRGIGAAGPGDAEYPYWRRLFEICGAAEPGHVTTTVDRQRVYRYWNTGLVAVRRGAGLFQAWERNFIAVMHEGLRPRRGLGHVEQSSFAGTVEGERARVRVLPPAYNYPIHLHGRIPAQARIPRLDGMVTAHYHRMFVQGSARNPLGAFTGAAELAWWNEQLHETGVYPRGAADRHLRRLNAYLRSYPRRLRKLVARLRLAPRAAGALTR